MSFAEKVTDTALFSTSEELKYHISELKYHLEYVQISLQEALEHLQNAKKHSLLIKEEISKAI